MFLITNTEKKLCFPEFLTGKKWNHEKQRWPLATFGTRDKRWDNYSWEFLPYFSCKDPYWSPEQNPGNLQTPSPDPENKVSQASYIFFSPQYPIHPHKKIEDISISEEKGRIPSIQFQLLTSPALSKVNISFPPRRLHDCSS